MKLVCRIVLALFIMAVAASCKKDHGDNKDTNPVIGYWELSYSQAGIVPAVNYPSGNGNILVLTASTYSYYEGGQLKKSGTYELKDEPIQDNVCLMIPASTFYRKIIYDGDNSASAYVEPAKDSLVFLGGCFAIDAGSEKKYRRIQPITL